MEQSNVEVQHTDIMVDLETLGTNPDTAIISIAAVAFDLRTGTTGQEFLVHIDVGSNIKAGRGVNPQTLAWWIDENGEVFAKWCNAKKTTLPTALLMFSNWLEEQILGVHSYQIWGNSNRFDLGFLADAYNHKIPWSHSAERDVRTLCMFDEGLKKETKKKFQAAGEDLHNPITDCKIQIEYCSKIYNDLKPSVTLAEDVTETFD